MMTMICPLACRKVTFPVLALAFGFVDISYGQQPAETQDKIYWSGLGSGIGRSNLDGSDTEYLARPDLRRPKDIALDVVGGKIYWTDSGRVSMVCSRCLVEVSWLTRTLSTGPIWMARTSNPSYYHCMKYQWRENQRALPWT